MIELVGKYGKAKVFTDVVEQSAISQVITLLNQEFTKDQRIRMMPDIHAGAGCTIGTTMTIGDKIVPNLVGVDIGCGMLVIRLGKQDIDFAKLDSIIYECIPSGMEVRDECHEYADSIDLEDLACAKHLNLDRAYHSIGTLGGGNHFIEVDEDDSGNRYLVIHTGSRYLGKQIAEYYQDLAYKKLNKCSDVDVSELIDRLKAEGKQKQIESELHKLKEVKRTSIPKDLAYLEGEDFGNYIHDMGIAQHYANLNRWAIANVILDKMGWCNEGNFTTLHNYIDTYAMILRKGSVSAMEDEELIIPINMRDGSLICRGKGNEDWNCSAPHGAGRIMSRRQAKESVSLEEFEKSMEGIYTTSVSASTIDESPMAYKPIESILDNIGDTVEVVDIIKPVYNFKAGEEEKTIA